MKITVLVENTSKNDLKCEHGLSFFIQEQGKNYLLDAGTSGIFYENAKVLGVPVCEVEACILSHGHYDHAGGLDVYLEENKECQVYAMENVDGEFYSASGGMHFIGVPKQILGKYGERLKRVQKVTKIAESVYLIPHNTEGLDRIGEKTQLFQKRGEKFFPDNFSHELSLVFDTEHGLVIFNSCSHGGVQNIIREVKEVFPEKQIYSFLGGLHMKGGNFSEEEIKLLVAFLQQEGLQWLYTGHCTGEPAMQLLRKYAGDMAQELSTGKIIIFK